MLAIYDGRKAFFQWDSGQKLLVSHEGVCDVHYKHPGEDTALVVKTYDLDGKTVADVPNILLQEAGTITAYVYICVGDACTIHKAIFTVIPRQRPADYVYTETEVKRYDTLVQDIAAMKERVYQDGLPYSEYETVVALDNYECPLNQNGAMQISVPLAVDYGIELYNAHWPFAIGTKLNVVFDGAEYETVCQFGPPGLFAGNAAGFGGTDTGEPFAIVFYCQEQGQGTGLYGLVSYPVAPTDHTITIIAEVETAVNAMDKKYMPGDMTELYLTATNGVKYKVTVTTSGTLAVTKAT